MFRLFCSRENLPLKTQIISDCSLWIALFSPFVPAVWFNLLIQHYDFPFFPLPIFLFVCFTTAPSMCFLAVHFTLFSLVCFVVVPLFNSKGKIVRVWGDIPYLPSWGLFGNHFLIHSQFKMWFLSIASVNPQLWWNQKVHLRDQPGSMITNGQPNGSECLESRFQ